MEELREYYNRRAPLYETVYAKEERQSDLQVLHEEVRRRLGGGRVLEIACGTGYWSSRIGDVAQSVQSVDQSDETLEIARSKHYARGNVRFLKDDAYQLEAVNGSFNMGFAGFWWSHVPKRRQAEFLKTYHARLEPGAKVVMIDNQFVSGSNHPITHEDDEGNTFQTRTLPDGTKYEVLKNFPSDRELRAVFAPFVREIEILRLQYYWILQYQI